MKNFRQILAEEKTYQHLKIIRKLKDEGKVLLPYWENAPKFLQPMVDNNLIIWERKGSKILITELDKRVEDAKAMLAKELKVDPSALSFKGMQGKLFLFNVNDPKSEYHKSTRSIKL